MQVNSTIFHFSLLLVKAIPVRIHFTPPPRGAAVGGPLDDFQATVDWIESRRSVIDGVL
jgi:hypothetical protein